MEAVQQRQNALVKIVQGGSQAGARGAGVVDGVALLGGTLRIEPQPHLLSRLLCPPAESPHLIRGVEHKVVRIGQQLLKLVLPVGRGEHVGLPAELLMSQSGLIEAAGGAPRQVFPDQGVGVKHGKCLLGQQNLAAGLLLHLPQDLQILPQQPLVHQEVGGGNSLSPAHQSTSTGSRSSCQGSPHWFRASMKGSGSNSSTLWTPGVFHLPVITIMAPIMAGTPVV